MNRRLLLLAVPILLLAAVASLKTYREVGPVSFHGTAYDPPSPAPQFALVNHEGERTTTADFEGKPLLVFFGYTHCPDVCPLTLANLRRTLAEIGAEEADVNIAMVTVDPARDTFEALAAYVRPHGANVTGLTGSPDALQSLFSAFGVYAQPAPGEHDHPEVMHSDVVFGIDSDGRLRVLLHPTDPTSRLEDDLRTLLRL